ncbi:tudor domain-containing protein [Caerostris darwini]|uniref:Tudor domain-containing protein n=1 Tax=Caerostris darwini TaxID=1538125 RepID=A0AAV4SX81_9ARAC|nr:tudor domain-containing protein [Caerostris darwini]
MRDNIQQFIILYKAISNNFKMPISHFECATNGSENQDNYSEDCNAHGNTSSVVVNGISTDHSRISDVQKVASCENVKRAVIAVSSTNAVGLVENFPATTDNATAVSVAEDLPLSSTNVDTFKESATNAAIEETSESSIVPVDIVIGKPREELVATNGATLNPGTLNGASEPFIPKEFGNTDAQVSNAAFVDFAEGTTAAPDAAFAIPGCSTFVPNELSATFASSVQGENRECATEDTLSISCNLKMPISLDECATNASPVNENWKEDIGITDALASNANGTQDTLVSLYFRSSIPTRFWLLKDCFFSTSVTFSRYHIILRIPISVSAVKAMWKHFKMPITHVEYATMPVSSTTAVVPVENLPVTSTSVIVDASTIVPEDTLREYVFKLPIKYASLLIGKIGSHRKTIKQTTGANLFIFNHLSTSSCCVSGSASQVEAALKMIENRFPAEHFPDFSVRTQLSGPPPPPNIDALKKTLPLNCITCVGPICIVSPGRILVQILSEDFWTLKDFTDSLPSTCDHFPPPNMPYVKEGDLCVYRRDDFNFWCRVKVVNVLENGVAAIRFPDYGGYLIVPVQTLKQIRNEYLQLRFQAVECHIYDILPTDASGASSAYRKSTD